MPLQSGGPWTPGPFCPHPIFTTLLAEDFNRIDAHYFIENAVANMTSCKRGHMYPTGPFYKLNWGETNPKSFPF